MKRIKVHKARIINERLKIKPGTFMDFMVEDHEVAAALECVRLLGAATGVGPAEHIELPTRIDPTQNQSN